MQAAVGQEHQHLQVVDLFLLLEEVEGFGAEAVEKAGMGWRTRSGSPRNTAVYQ